MCCSSHSSTVSTWQRDFERLLALRAAAPPPAADPAPAPSPAWLLDADLVPRRAAQWAAAAPAAPPLLLDADDGAGAAGAAEDDGDGVNCKSPDAAGVAGGGAPGALALTTEPVELTAMEQRALERKRRREQLRQVRSAHGWGTPWL